MSCRSNAGNSMATSHARFSSGLSDVQTLSLFHALVREGAAQSNPAPTPQQVTEWVNQFTAQVRADQSLNETQRQSLIARAERIGQLPTPPNGATFYAWQNMQARATQTREALDYAYENVARNLGVSPEEVRQQARQLQNEALNSSRQLRPPEEFVEQFQQSNTNTLLADVPQDRATMYALYRLNEQARQRQQEQQAQAQAVRNLITLEAAITPATTVAVPPQEAAPRPIQREPISSSFIGAIGYDPTSSRLQVEFNNGSLYQYEGVSPALYREMLQSPSVGRVYTTEIRGNYPSTRLQGPGGTGGGEGIAAVAQVQAARPVVAEQLSGERLASLAAQQRSREQSQEALRAMLQPRSRSTTLPATGATAAVAEPETSTSRATREAEAVARQAFSRPTSTSTPTTRSFKEDMTAFQSAYDAAKARKARGESPVPYLRENATGGLGSRAGGRGFGVELEFDLQGVPNQYQVLQEIGRELNAAGLTTSPYQQGYHSGSGDYSQWRFEQDSTVSGEIISPIMYDEPQSWEQLAKVCEIVKRHGGKATARTGGHVHVAAGNYDHTPKNHNNLLKMFKENEDVLYRMAQNPDRNQHRGTQWCSPNHVPTQDYNTVQEVRQRNNSHGLGLNFQAVTGSENDHVEFRMWDGSLEPGVIQSQIKMSLGMTEAAFRASPDQTASSPRESVGSHHTRNRSGSANGGGRARRLSGEEWQTDTQGFRQLVDQLFSRDEDKEQATALFAVTKWQKAGR